MPRLVLKAGDGYSFPLGIAYISAAMKKAGFATFTVNLNHRDGDVADILRDEIARHRIDVVATGGLSFQYSTIRTVLDAARQARPDIVTVVGGGIVAGDPEATMAALEVADYGVVGEGEITICELCAAIENGTDLSTVDGLIYRRDGRFARTRPRREMDDIDSLPWPDYEGFDFDRYLAASPSVSGMNRKNTLFMIASRSCPYNCTFCFHTIGRRYRQRSLDLFFEELDFMVSRYQIDYLCLADELFARKPERMKAFCEGMRRHGIRWWAQFRVDDVTPDMMGVLKDGGCDIMSFGLESADNRVLRSMRKGTTVEQIERALKMVYDAGISMEGAFIFGDLAETWETAQNTLQWWREHAQYKINLNVISVYPGSHLYQYACEHGIIRDRVQFLRDGCPHVNVSKLTDEEFARLLTLLMEAPMTLARTLRDVEAHMMDETTGRVSVQGVCTACAHRNTWNGAKLFNVTFLACAACGQRYNVTLTPPLRRNVDRHVEDLIARHGKVALWGVNYHTADLVRHSAILRRPEVFVIDISGIKQKMDLHGKRVYPPEIIEREGIGTVVAAIPAYHSQIAGQVAANHRNVHRVIGIESLVRDLPDRT
jgi:radical SAM superfamily enzyme YgiQ (UPF0313 family)